MLVSKSNGLKLTYATLAAFTKYPRPSFIPHRDIARRSQKKYGFLSINWWILSKWETFWEWRNPAWNVGYAIPWHFW
ncbi:hypothetical protein V8V91_16330 [Algoriphagus halophilus]